MNRYMATTLTTMFVLCFSSVVFAQSVSTDKNAQTAQQKPTEKTTEKSTEKTSTEAADPADGRAESDCRDWAVQDGVPSEELSTYIQDCIEDHKAQE